MSLINDRIIGLEGTDGSGKNTVAIAIIETLLKQTNYIIFHTSFPNYWTPQGTIIREMNRELGDEYSQKNKLSLEDHLRLRLAMYSLDRALTFLVVDRIKRENDRKLVQVSDRLFLSQVNTVAYLVTKNNNFTEAKKLFLRLFPIALKSDMELMENTNNYTPILSPRTVRLSFSKSRPELDKLEGARPREFANWGYQLIPYKYPKISSSIIENQDRYGKWIDKYELASIILKKAGFKNIKKIRKSLHLCDDKSTKKVIIVSPTLYLETFYDIDSLSFEKINKLETLWKRIMLCYNDDSIDIFNREKKEYLNEIEYKMASLISDFMNNNKPSSKKIDKLNDWPFKAIKRLTNEYSRKNLIPFIKFGGKKLKYGNGYLTLLKSLEKNF